MRSVIRRHVCWLNHTMREYYDLWDRFSATLSPRALLKERARRWAIHAADRYLLTRNVSRLFVQSRTIQRRLAMWPELRSTVLYPPAPQRGYRCDGYGDYVFLVSRLTRLKRVDLLDRGARAARRDRRCAQLSPAKARSELRSRRLPRRVVSVIA